MVVNDVVPYPSRYKHVAYEMDDLVVLCSEPIGLTWRMLNF